MGAGHHTRQGTPHKATERVTTFGMCVFRINGGDTVPKINLNLKKSIFNEVYFSHLFDYSNRYEVYYGG